MRVNFQCIISLCLIISCNSNRPKPNIVLVLTDDQDLVVGGLTPMVKTQKFIANKGVTLTNAFVTTPICCPSRSSLLTGKYLHNHGTVNNSVSGGCNGANWLQNQEPHSFVTYLKASGYTTFYAGKYLNQYGHGMNKSALHVPLGWDWWLGLVGNSRYYNYTLSVNGTAKHFSNEYLTDVIKLYGFKFLDENQRLGSSFLMVLAPPAPHAPFTPAPQYKDHFRDVKAFKSPNFNIPVKKDRHWLLRMSPSPLPAEFMPTLDEVYHRRWETLLSVDDMVESVVMQLDSAGILNNTFFMFTSDHGYHIGQFGLPWDKRQPYESDIRVPFLVRGPGIPEKQTMTMPVVNIDIAPTILDIAGIPIPETMDGISFLPSLLNPTQFNAMERMFLIEYHGEGAHSSVAQECGYTLEDTLSECSPESMCKCQDARNNTYSCVRSMNFGDDILYCQFQDTEHFVELYDLTKDPYQLHNIASSNSEKMSHYNTLLSRFKACHGVSCRSLGFEKLSADAV